jgi:hypothetical protein
MEDVVMAKRHYHVVENTPGYLPDDMDNPCIFTNRKEAVTYARELADELRELGYRVSGRDGDYYGELHANDLGRAIETMECTDDCETVD